MIIAIDGPAGAGKGTLARRLAAAFRFAYLDTGALYRAVGVAVLDAGGDPADPAAAEAAARALGLDLIESPRLRTEAAGEAASKVAAIPAVRAALLEFQRGFAAAPPSPCVGAVLDGRDIGTVVCPGADLKLFVTASAEERARRRTLELRAKGIDAIQERVLADMLARDERDRDRKVAPLAPAKDAVVLDTTAMDADMVFDRAAVLVRERTVAG
ncbi:cytidylate kinase [uncultured Alphaproteobacteria bacterium]|uniref:Cytidylate kinase n=1 Tax=uncultured Alphaproteobacteria bacterium TaxID=91750 RepID=A0A212KKG8_9PROT|nr:cytidylate kinase [uncultured Alphaproteobacteria bacterium]